jgi:hypothetical protein
MEFASLRPALVAVRLRGLVGLCVALAAALASCGGDKSSNNDSGGSTSTVPKGRLGARLGTNLRVINRGPENMRIRMCHPGECKPSITLRKGEVEALSASSVDGYFWYERPGRPILQVNFDAGNPDIGKPFILAHPRGDYGGGIEWRLSEGQYIQHCYALRGVGIVGGGRDTDINGYKRLRLEPSSEGECKTQLPPLR